MKIAKRFLTGIFAFMLVVSFMTPFRVDKAHGADTPAKPPVYVPNETYLTDVKTDLPDGVYSMPARLHHSYQK